MTGRPGLFCPQRFTSLPKWTALAHATTCGNQLREHGVCSADSASVLPNSGVNACQLESRRAHERSRHERWADCSQSSSWPTPGAPHEMHAQVSSVFPFVFLRAPHVVQVWPTTSAPPMCSVLFLGVFFNVALYGGKD